MHFKLRRRGYTYSPFAFATGLGSPYSIFQRLLQLWVLECVERVLIIFEYLIGTEKFDACS